MDYAAAVPSSRRSPEVLKPALLASAALMIVVGLGVWLILGETTIGLIIAGIGVFDLLTMRFVVGAIQKGQAAQSEPAAGEAPTAQPDPDYNPYARED